MINKVSGSIKNATQAIPISMLDKSACRASKCRKKVFI